MTDSTVEEATPEEGRRIFTEACRRELGITPQEYFAAGLPGGQDPDQWDHEAYMRVAILEPFWSDK